MTDAATKPAKIRLVALAAATALAATGLVACSSDSSDSSSDTQVEQAMGATVDAPRVVVVDPGTNPQVLSYKDLGEENADEDASPQEITLALADGFTQQIVAADQVDVQAPAGGTVTTLTAPVKVESVKAQADSATGATRSVSITVNDPKIDNLEQADDVSSASGFRVGWFAQDSGQVTSVNYAAPTQATDTGRALVEGYFTSLVPQAVVFPTDPVGVGGTWTVDVRVASDTTMLRTTTYTVTAIDGDKVSLNVDVAQRPVLGAISAELSDGTHTLNVLNSNTTTQGAIVVDLNQPLPISGQVAFTTRVIYGEDTTQTRVVQDTTTAVTFGEAS